MGKESADFEQDHFERGHHMLSRRTFLSGAAGALVIAGVVGMGGLSACSDDGAAEGNPKNGGVEDDEGMTCDIVVAGGGISGMLAALSAFDEGADVILIEKQGALGGSAALSSGFMVTVDNRNFDDKPDIDDSMETTMNYLMSIHNQSENRNYPNVERLRATFAQQGETIDFMLSLGMTADFQKKSTAVTAWDGGGSGMVEALATILDAKGIKVLLDSAAKEVIVEDGKVVGLKMSQRNSDVVIHAKKVIMATGGAAWNKAIVESYMPTLANMTINQMSAPGNTGDGFEMLKAIGAKPYDSMVLLGGGIDYDGEWRRAIETRPTTADKLAFDATGARFANEAPTAPQILTYQMVKLGSSAYYWLYDSSNEALKKSLDTGVEMGVVSFGETLAELAGKIGVDASKLNSTFERYQEICAAGVDNDFGKAAANLVAYATEGGYYAVLYSAAAWGTIGGSVTDESCHVYDEQGEVIENLFAVGEMSNREMFSDFYIGGNSLATSSTMGRIAARTAVSEIA
jgi:fumarate reductase flavoprotein subunit